MNSCVLSGLTQEEATEALRIALHRHPALQFRVVASADPTGAYELVLDADDAQRLSRFELGFMSATAIRATHVLPARMPEYCEKLIAGYRVEIRAGQPSENDEAVSSQWAFHVRKTD